MVTLEAAVAEAEFTLGQLRLVLNAVGHPNGDDHSDRAYRHYLDVARAYWADHNLTLGSPILRFDSKRFS